MTKRDNGSAYEDATWFDVAGVVEQVLSDPARHGFRSEAEAFAASARQTGMSATTLRQNIAARRFLVDHYADRVAMKPPTVGCTQILIFSRLYRAAMEEADRIVDDVLDGRITRVQLADLLKRTRSAPEDGVAFGARTEGKASAMAFEQAGLAFITHVLDRFTASPAELVRDWRCRGLMADAAIFRTDSSDACIRDPWNALALVEVKGPRRETHRSRARETIAMGLFCQRVVPEVILVLPWENPLLGDVKAMIDVHGIEGQHLVQVATCPESPTRFAYGEVMSRKNGVWQSEIISKKI